MLRNNSIGFWRFQHFATLILAVICSIALAVSRMDSSKVQRALERVLDALVLGVFHTRPSMSPGWLCHRQRI